jgi:TonB family protein
MTDRYTLRKTLTLLSVVALAGWMGMVQAAEIPPADSTAPAPNQAAVEQAMVEPAFDLLPILGSDSRQASITMGGMVQGGRLIHMTAPSYPPTAKQVRVTGVVTIEARIGKDGRVMETSVLRGPLPLRQIAEDAVKHWQYEPTLLNGTAVERIALVDLSFVLGRY